MVQWTSGRDGSSGKAGMQPATILFLAANPVRMQALQLGEECRTIEDKIRAARFRDQIRFRSRWAARPDDFLQALNEDTPSVLHFSGHGAGEQGLCFQSEDGNALTVTADALAKVMEAAGASVVVVVLNACYSEVQARALVAYVPCVIGMTEQIGDEDARVYSASFYSALASGSSVAKAHRQGIAALALAQVGGQLPRANPAKGALAPRLLTRPDTDADCIYIVEIADGSVDGSTAVNKPRVHIVIDADMASFDEEVLGRVKAELCRLADEQTV
jgi:hypothetical protein